MVLEQKSVFVSGANRGIGAALVEALLDRNVQKVYAAARDVMQLPDFEDARVVSVSLDITNQKHIMAAAAFAADTDVLINNAGIAGYASAIDGPIEIAEQEMAVNYFGTLRMMRAFVPHLLCRTDPRIVNIASIASFVNFPFLGGYSASKAALYSGTQGARLELASKGIGVHSVNPGPIDTDMAKDVEMEKASPQLTASRILDGIEADEPDIFPDDGGRGMFDVWNADYRALESMVADMIGAAQ